MTTAIELHRALLACRSNHVADYKRVFGLANNFDLNAAAKMLDAADPEFREVDEAPKDLRDPVVDERNTDWDDAPQWREAPSWPNIGVFDATHAKAKQIVEAIRGYEDNSATMPRQNLIRLDFSLTDEAAVAMVAELMRPTPHEEWWNEILAICIHAGMHKEDMPLRWLKERLNGPTLGIAQDLNRRLYELAQEFGLDCGDVIASLREILEALRAKSGFGQIENEVGGRKVKVPYHCSEAAVVGVAQEFGFTGGTVAVWLREKLEDWQRQRAHNVELTAEQFLRNSEPERLGMLTAIWNTALTHGWTSSDGTNLAGFVEGKLNELADCKNQNANWRSARGELSSLKDDHRFLHELLDVLREAGWPEGYHAVGWLRDELSRRPSKDSFDATERGRLDAIGELRAFKQVHTGTIDRLTKERDEARGQRDHVIKTMRQMRRRVGEIAEGAWE